PTHYFLLRFKNSKKMKKNCLLIIALCWMFQLTAQEETLFDRARVVGAFGGPFIEYSFGNDDVTTSVGGGGALIINDFFIGGYGIGSIDQNVFDPNFDRIELAHGGFWLGYTYPSHKLVHLYTSVRLGWGGIGIDFNDDFNTVDGVFVVSPEAGLELNVFGFFRIAATAGYRFVDGINTNISGVESDAFNGVTGMLTFRFGGFGRYRRW
ncbi:MAG: hypothetical protein AAF985_07610, partial [Bacteroidota bacterium]